MISKNDTAGISYKKVSSKLEQPLFILTSEELQFFYVLHFADMNTLWGTAIEKVIQLPTSEKIRTLIRELKSAYDDSPRCLISIIGTEGCNLFMKL
jgi:hypothetical protein